VNCPYSLFGTFFHKFGCNLGINQADYVINVARDALEISIDLATFDLSSLGVDEVDGAVEFNFVKTF
jgi:hypothetical protein